MGLAQKRIVQEFQETKFDAWKKEFDKAVGHKIEVEVRWETMQSDTYDKRDQYFNWYEAVYFKPLLQCFQDLCKDKMGKDAVKASVKKIIIDGSEGSSYQKSTFDKGVLTINHKFHTNVDAATERRDGWREMIESKL